MGTYNISKHFDPPTADLWRSDKAAAVMRMFGLTMDTLADKMQTHSSSAAQLEINDGDIVYITGPSGAGKTVLLKELEKAVPAQQRLDLAQIRLPRDKTLIDCIDADVVMGLRLLSVAGLSDCLCILNQPANLSDGQKYRFRLAMAIAAKKKFVFADEFCSNLDRITASTISYTIHKFAKRYKVTFLLASSHEDMLADLQPDVIITKELSGPTKVVYKNSVQRTAYSV